MEKSGKDARTFDESSHHALGGDAQSVQSRLQHSWPALKAEWVQEIGSDGRAQGHQRTCNEGEEKEAMG